MFNKTLHNPVRPIWGLPRNCFDDVLWFCFPISSPLTFFVLGMVTWSGGEQFFEHTPYSLINVKNNFQIWKTWITVSSDYLNGAEYGILEDLMLPIGEGLKAMARLCSSAHWTNRRSLLTLPVGLFCRFSLRFGLREMSIFFSSTADVFVYAASRFCSALYALLA